MRPLYHELSSFAGSFNIKKVKSSESTTRLVIDCWLLKEKKKSNKLKVLEEALDVCEKGYYC